MSEDIERNLDTQSRRLDDIENLIRATLDDQEPAASLEHGPRYQTYDELTTFNDDLRGRRDWTDVDLDAALTEEQRQAFELWQQKHRLTWSTSDLVAVGAVGVVGMMCTWFDASIDGSIRDRLTLLKSSGIVSGWEKAGKRLPIDYMGTKRLLRIMTASNRSSHALARAAVIASRSEPNSHPPQETAQALRRAATITKSTITDVKRAIDGELVKPPEKLTETSIPDVMLHAAIKPGPARGAVRALNTLNRTIGEALTRV